MLHPVLMSFAILPQSSIQILRISADCPSTKQKVKTLKLQYNLFVLSWLINLIIKVKVGCTMAQVVNHQPLTVEAPVHARVSLCESSGGQSCTGTGVSLSSSLFPCQYYHSTNASYLCIN
jgi:hypothetical protein